MFMSLQQEITVCNRLNCILVSGPYCLVQLVDEDVHFIEGCYETPEDRRKQLCTLIDFDIHEEFPNGQTLLHYVVFYNNGSCKFGL